MSYVLSPDYNNKNIYRLNSNENKSLNSFLKSISSIIRLLELSVGKNKLFNLLQYSCKLIGTTIIYSIDTTLLLESKDVLE